ncbi:plasmid mobilization relaxosome protein MobC [Neisseria weixii]|uniref:plasmid mobilization relaxosome protein MobC n=1 Tax=Neisseria weixii TaxID=1853276 RepID=UPI000BB8C0C2|nr:plasmid mobilization relaxosome protein MobC [Neisseria weixii]ATD64605.1 hypothetical protein CGZ65_03460 [Neisseria weixii]
MNNAIDTADKRRPVRVFGLTESELEALRNLALKKYGKDSVSLLAKKLLQAQLDEAEEPELVKLPTPKGSKRITVRLPEKDRAYLEMAAAQHHSSVNDVVRDIVQAYIRKHPSLSAAEVDVLYRSNYQLLSIGRNLNQIARQLNMGESASVTSEHIKELTRIIKQHTEKVAGVLRTNRKRLAAK